MTWIFLNENGTPLGFKTLKDAVRYVYEIYDKNIKSLGKQMNGSYAYVNSWNCEEVYLYKLKVYNFAKNTKEVKA